MKKKEIQIICGEGQDAYWTTLRVKDLSVFEKASKDPDVVGKEGEAFVAAILATSSNSGILEITRHRDGKFVDGANGEAAWQAFRKGQLVCADHYNQDGKRHYGVHGEAAREVFNDTVGFGFLFRQNKVHYDNGRKLKRKEVNEKATQNIKAANPGLKIR